MNLCTNTLSFASENVCLWVGRLVSVLRKFLRFLRGLLPQKQEMLQQTLGSLQEEVKKARDLTHVETEEQNKVSQMEEELKRKEEQASLSTREHILEISWVWWRPNCSCYFVSGA